MPARQDAFDEAYGQGVPRALRHRPVAHPGRWRSSRWAHPGGGGPPRAGGPGRVGVAGRRDDGAWVGGGGGRTNRLGDLHQAPRCPPRDRHRRRDLPGPHRSARPSRVQRVRRVGASQAVHQPGSVAGQPGVRQARQGAMARAHLGGEVGLREDRHDALRGGAGGCRRGDGDPGSVEGLPEEGRSVGAERGPADLRRAGGPQHRRLRPSRSRGDREHPQGDLRHQDGEGSLHPPRRGTEDQSRPR